ncbi:MAG: O-antigen ligase family protein [Candidatus Omnitrophica bacterium]|nr:O-antigen ligase family protein [Candidatus Omnitrophota bacterium]
MSALAVRRNTAAVQPPALSKGLLFGLMCLLLFLGYVMHTETQLPGPLIALGGIAGLMALFIVGLRRLDLPLYIMVIYLPFSKQLAGDFGGIISAVNLTNMLFLVILISAFSNRPREGELHFERHILHLPILLLVAWGTVTFLYWSFLSRNQYFVRFLPDFKRWMDPIVLYFLFFHLVKDQRRWKAIVVLMMIGVALVAALAVHDYMGVSEGTSLDKSRIGGIAGQPNILGAFFVYYMFLYAGFWLENLRRGRAWLFWLPFLLCFRGIMVTFSRGAYLAFAQGVLGLTYFKNKALFALAVGGIACIIFNPSILPEGIRFRVESTFKSKTELTSVYGMRHLEEEVDRSAAIRIEIWKATIEMIKDHPWFGVSFGRFKSHLHLYLDLGRQMDAHNAYLILAAEQGIPALVLFLVSLLVLFRVTVVVYRRHPDPFIRSTALGFLGGLSGLFMANMWGSRVNTTETSGYLWIMAALMARAYLWTREQAPQRSVARRAGPRRPNGRRTAAPAAPSGVDQAADDRLRGAPRIGASSRQWQLQQKGRL